MKKLFLHIGLPKTGTSSIQKNLVENRRCLKEQGVIIISRAPRIGRFPEITMAMNSNSKKEISAFQQKIKEGVENSKEQKFILSEETLGQMLLKKNHRAASLKNLLSGLNVTIIYYHRDLFSYLISLYFQFTKTGKNTANFESFIKDNFNRFSFDGMCKQLTTVFGDENVIRRPFDSDQLLNGDVVDDFMGQLNLSYTKYPSQNVSPPRYLVEFYKFLRLKYFRDLSHHEFRTRVFKKYEKLKLQIDDPVNAEAFFLDYLLKTFFTNDEYEEVINKLERKLIDLKNQYPLEYKISPEEKVFVKMILDQI